MTWQSWDKTLRTSNDFPTHISNCVLSLYFNCVVLRYYFLKLAFVIHDNGNISFLLPNIQTEHSLIYILVARIWFRVKYTVTLLEAELRSCHDNIIFGNLPYSLPFCEAAVSLVLRILRALIYCSLMWLPLQKKFPKFGFMGIFMFMFVSLLVFSTAKLHKTVF